MAVTLASPSSLPLAMETTPGRIARSDSVTSMTCLPASTPTAETPTDVGDQTHFDLWSPPTATGNVCSRTWASPRKSASRPRAKGATNPASPSSTADMLANLPLFCNASSAKGGLSDRPWPAYSHCDPITWDSAMLMRWLEESVFTGDKARREDLEHYKLHFVSGGERLDGQMLSYMMFAEFYIRWGQSAEAVWKDFLQQLSRHRHSQNTSDPCKQSLLDMWWMMEATRPVKTPAVTSRDPRRRKNGISRQPLLSSVSEGASSDGTVTHEDDISCRDEIMSIAAGDEEADRDMLLEETDTVAHDQTGASDAMTKSLGKATADLLWQSHDLSMTSLGIGGLEEPPIAMGPVGQLSVVQHSFEEEQAVTMEPIGPLRIAQAASDSDYGSFQSSPLSQPGSSYSPGSSDTLTPASPASSQGSTSRNGGSESGSSSALERTPSPPCDPGFQKLSQCVERRRQRKLRQHSPLPPLPTFPDPLCLQLWEYLLELLADRAVYGQIIAWKDREAGVFTLLDAEVVACLWGLYRKRQTMNYDKMSRAMRYYYNKRVDKVSGSRLTYKFLAGTDWLTYLPRATGYNNQFAGNTSLVCHSRLSRRSSTPPQPQKKFQTRM